MSKLLRSYARFGLFLELIVGVRRIVQLLSIENLDPDSTHTFFERYYDKAPRSDMHMPMLCRGFLPRYAHQLRSTFLHLVETSSRPSTANGLELIGYKVFRKQECPSTLLLAVLLFRAEVRRAQNTRPFQKLTDTKAAVKWFIGIHPKERSRVIGCNEYPFWIDFSLFDEKLRGSVHTDKIRFHVVLDLSRGIGPHLPTG
jgi:hypothetical protein